jgi:recombination protein RecT
MGVDKILSMVDLAGSIEKAKAYRGIVERTIPKNHNPVRYWAMYAEIIRKWAQDPKCVAKETILPTVFNAAKLGLYPDPIMGQIFFIPYKGKLTYQLGYKGMTRLSYNTGEISDIRAGLVYEKDPRHEFYEDEKGQHFIHEPQLDAKNLEARGKRLFGWSAFTDMKGHVSIHVMEGYHIDDIKKLVLARMGDSSTPWKDPLFESEMQKKTVTRRHWKYQPMSPEIAQVIEHEEANERGEIKQENHPELAGIIDGMVDASKENSAALTDAENAALDLQAAKEARQ